MFTLIHCKVQMEIKTTLHILVCDSYGVNSKSCTFRQYFFVENFNWRSNYHLSQCAQSDELPSSRWWPLWHVHSAQLEFPRFCFFFKHRSPCQLRTTRFEAKWLVERNRRNQSGLCMWPFLTIMSRGSFVRTL